MSKQGGKRRTQKGHPPQRRRSLESVPHSPGAVEGDHVEAKARSRRAEVVSKRRARFNNKITELRKNLSDVLPERSVERMQKLDLLNMAVEYIEAKQTEDPQATLESMIPIDLLADLLFLLDSSGQILQANIALKQILGSPEDLEGEYIYTYVHQDDVQMLKDNLEKGYAESFSCRLQDKQGVKATFSLSVRGMHLRNRDYLLLTAQLVSKDLLLGITVPEMKNLPVRKFWSLHFPEGKTYYSFPCAPDDTIFGFPSKTFTSVRPYTMMHPDDAPFVSVVHQSMLDRQTPCLIYNRIRGANGRFIQVATGAIPCVDGATGKTEFFVSLNVYRDDNPLEPAPDSRASHSQLTVGPPISFRKVDDLVVLLHNMAIDTRHEAEELVKAVEAREEAVILHRHMQLVSAMRGAPQPPPHRSVGYMPAPMSVLTSESALSITSNECRSESGLSTALGTLTTASPPHPIRQPPLPPPIASNMQTGAANPLSTLHMPAYFLPGAPSNVLPAPAPLAMMGVPQYPQPSDPPGPALPYTSLPPDFSLDEILLCAPLVYPSQAHMLNPQTTIMDPANQMNPSPPRPSNAQPARPVTPNQRLQTPPPAGRLGPMGWAQDVGQLPKREKAERSNSTPGSEGQSRRSGGGRRGRQSGRSMPNLPLDGKNPAHMNTQSYRPAFPPQPIEPSVPPPPVPRQTSAPAALEATMSYSNTFSLPANQLPNPVAPQEISMSPPPPPQAPPAGGSAGVPLMPTYLFDFLAPSAPLNVGFGGQSDGTLTGSGSVSSTYPPSESGGGGFPVTATDRALFMAELGSLIGLHFAQNRPDGPNMAMEEDDSMQSDTGIFDSNFDGRQS